MFTRRVFPLNFYPSEFPTICNYQTGGEPKNHHGPSQLLLAVPRTELGVVVQFIRSAVKYLAVTNSISNLNENTSVLANRSVTVFFTLSFFFYFGRYSRRKLGSRYIFNVLL